MRFCLVVFLALHALACGREGQSSPPDSGIGPGQPDAGDTGYPPPRTNLVAPVGQAGAIDIATWNIENFPRAGQTPSLMADLIASLRLDLVAVQEIEDDAAFEELVTRLPHHEGLLSSHTYGDGSYQKVGYIYRSDLLSLTGGALLFQNQGFDFPRPPMQAVAEVTSGAGAGFDFVLITAHLKAGVSAEDRARRTAAIEALEEHVRSVVDGGTDGEIVILGDFNEILDTADGRAVFEPFLSAPADYHIRTDSNAQDGEYSFIPSERLLDHVITTSGLDQEMTSDDALVRPLEAELSVYLELVSDHRPVFVSLTP